MAYMEETTEQKITENGATPSKVAGTSEALPPKQAPGVRAIAVPDELMNKILVVLRKMSYETVGDIMEELKREAVGVNLTK